MRQIRQDRFLGMWMLLGALFILPGTLAAADNEETASDRSWLDETLHRFFGNKALTGEALDGEGLELVSPFVEHVGKTIEVVIIRQVKSFEKGWDDDRQGAERLLNSLSKNFQDYTKESTLRQYLLFKAGDKLDPFDLSDSERMIRDLGYINDVRIHVIPIDGEPDKVGIVVETNDRWPLGVAVTVVTADRWRAKLFSSNVAGTGLYFSNQVLRNKTVEKDWGYNGLLRKENIAGTFWTGVAEYENSYRKDLLSLGIERRLIHLGMKYIGGVSWKNLNDYERDGRPHGFHETDAWLGKAIKLYDPREIVSGGRTMLVPAIRFQDRDFYNRRAVSPDSNRGDHNFSRYFAALTLQRTKSYKTSFLFGEGEVEDLPTGVTIKVSGGMEDREFEYRPGIFFDSAAISMRNRGDVTSLGVSIGGFLKDGHVDDGILDLNGAYFTPLWGEGKVRHRLLFASSYTLGIGRHPFDKIYLSDRSGIYKLDNGVVAGNQRVVLKSLYRIFTHWSVLGFRMSFFTFGDVGAIAGEDDPIFKQKFYVSTGLGVRLRNPALVLPTFQFRVSLLSNVEDRGMSFGFKLGNATGPEIKYPGTKPGTLAYE